jgi:ABC-type polysaccharide/polyol phosphate export permease
MTTTPEKATVLASTDEYFGEQHVYQPHRAGIPDLRVYWKELLRRRHFAAELSRSQMRAAHTNTFFGQLWLVLNPLLLATVYYVLVDLLSTRKGGAPHGYFAHLCSGLFAFYFIAACMTTGGQSVIGGGKLVMNTAFPRLLLPLSAVRSAFFRFMPTMIVYVVLHLIARLPITFGLLAVVPILVLITLFGSGLACLFGLLYIYFRDISSFLPYFNRIWLYMSPVILTVQQIHEKFAGAHVSWLAYFNPLYPLLGSWSNLLSSGGTELPSLAFWFSATVWAVGMFVFGTVLFMSREREFAVRI